MTKDEFLKNTTRLARYRSCEQVLEGLQKMRKTCHLNGTKIEIRIDDGNKPKILCLGIDDIKPEQHGNIIPIDAKNKSKFLSQLELILIDEIALIELEMKAI